MFVAVLKVETDEKTGSDLYLPQCDVDSLSCLKLARFFGGHRRTFRSGHLPPAPHTGFVYIRIVWFMLLACCYTSFTLLDYVGWCLWSQLLKCFILSIFLHVWSSHGLVIRLRGTMHLACIEFLHPVWEGGGPAVEWLPQSCAKALVSNLGLGMCVEMHSVSLCAELSKGVTPYEGGESYKAVAIMQRSCHCMLCRGPGCTHVRHVTNVLKKKKKTGGAVN